MKLIYIFGGKVAKVDDSDYDFLSQFSWHMSHGYATRCVGSKAKIKMHQVLMDAPVGMEIDHRDCDKLNNVRSNLRLCQHHKNMRNLKPRYWLRFKGVGKNGATGKGFQARLRWKGFPHFHLGSFTTEEAAARAYDRKAHELDPEFAKLNFSEGIWTEEQLSEFRIETNPASGITGVYPSGGKWVSHVKRKGKIHHVGTYPTKEEAMHARANFISQLSEAHT